MSSSTDTLCLIKNAIKAFSFSNPDVNGKWSRNSETNTYEMQCFITGPCCLIHKVKSSYVVENTGEVYSTLRESKAAAIDWLKAISYTKIEEMNSRMNNRYSIEPYQLDKVSYQIITWAASKVFRDTIVTSSNENGFLLRDSNSRFGNAVAAFDLNGHMLSFMNFAIPFSSLDATHDRTIVPKRLCFQSTINLDIEGVVLQRDKEFGDNGFYSCRLRGFDDASLIAAGCNVFSAAINRAELVSTQKAS